MAASLPVDVSAGAVPLTRSESRALWAYVALVVAGFAYFLVDLPVQVTDCFGNMRNAARGTFVDVVYREFFQQSYLRPFLWAHIKVLQELSGGAYTLTFRGWHVVQVAVLAALFVHIVKPRDLSGAAALPVGLAVLLGIHTFGGTVREAFPVNTFMTILLCCYAALALALGPPRWWRDVAAALLFVFASLTVESGLLVWVVVVSAWLAGARGVSRSGILLQLLLLAGYFVLRFGVLHIGSPGLEERSSGFGFSSRDPEDLIASFGGNPLPFYAYNIVSSALSVFLGEPRGGVWLVTRDALAGRYFTPMSVGALACTLGAVFIFRYVWVRRREWLARRFDRGDQIVFTCLGVTAANAVISFPYTKDVIMSPAGIFFAAAVTVALRDVLMGINRASLARACVWGVLVALLSSTWAVRELAIHYGLRTNAAAERGEWAYVDGWLEREHQVLTDPMDLALKSALQEQAVYAGDGRPALDGDWFRWFESE
jgi:hypothetical protein